MAADVPEPPDRVAGRPGPKLLRPLKIRDFALLWVGLTVSLLGDGMFYVALPIQAFRLDDSAATYSLVLLAWTIPLVAFLIPAGVLSDRFDRRSLLIISNTCQGTAIGVIGLLSVAGDLELWHLFVAAAVYGSAEALFGPAFGALVPEIVPGDLLVQANSLDNFSRPLTLRVAGPALGGVIVAVFGVGYAFLIDASTFLVANLALALIRPRPMRRRGRDMAWREIREGARFVRAHRWLWVTLLATAVGALVFYGPWQALVPYVITREIGGSESDLGLVLAVGGTASLLASIVIGQSSLPRRSITLMYFSFGVGTLMLTGFGLARGVGQAMVASFCMQGLFTAGIIVWNTTMHRLVPGDILGRVSSLDWFVSTSLIPVSLALAGPLSHALGPSTTLVFAGIVGCVVILSFLLVPGVRGPEERAAGTEIRVGPTL